MLVSVTFKLGEYILHQGQLISLFLNEPISRQ